MVLVNPTQDLACNGTKGHTQSRQWCRRTHTQRSAMNDNLGMSRMLWHHTKLSWATTPNCHDHFKSRSSAHAFKREEELVQDRPTVPWVSPAIS